MIERYTRPEMAKIWADEHRLQLMLEVEAAFLMAIAREKKIPAAEFKSLRSVLGKPLVEKVSRFESKSSHEVVSLLQVISAEIRRKSPTINRYLHYGLTSSDVLDTVLALQLKESAGLILQDWKKAASKIGSLARKHAATWMVGRTHGVHAEPIIFGVKLAGWHAEAVRNISRMERSRQEIAYGKFSGAVGAYTHLPPSIEAAVCRDLGLKAEPVSTQVIPRDRHADFFHSLVLSAAAIERYATEIRHLQRTEVLELEEPFTEGQKGSSAMPHKRNPVLCENLCGLARLIRSYEAGIVENIVLWHERDISHSSYERVALPDAAIVLDFMLHRFARIIEGLQVYPEKMRANLDDSMGLVFSQKVLLRLIDKGLGRLDAYEIVQRNAMKTWKTRADFYEVLSEDKDVKRVMNAPELKACFDLNGYKRSSREILRRSGVY